MRGYHATPPSTIAAAARRARRSAKAALARGDATPAASRRARRAEKALPAEAAELLDAWPQAVEDYSGDELVVKIRDKELRTQLTRETLSGNKIRRVSLPKFGDDGELLGFLRRENLPGHFPFTAGVFPFKREGEDPARMFAGEGDAFRTNRRFKYLSADSRPSGCRPRSTR